MVITIIVALLAIFLPAMQDAIEASQRTACGSNQHQLFLGVLSYIGDNRATPPETTYRTTTDATSGRTAMALTVSDLPAHRKYFNAHSMQRYIGGVDLERKRLDGAWVCPSNPVGPLERHEFEFDTPSLRYFGGWYSYFGRVGQWSTHASHPEELMDRMPGAGRIMFAETIFYSQYWGASGGGGYWTYNHGEGGPADIIANNAAGYDRDADRPHTTGANQTYGDGSTVWVAVRPEHFDTGRLDPDVGRVSRIYPEELGYFLRK